MSVSPDHPARARSMGLALLAWLVLYVLVGVEIAMWSPRGSALSLVSDWTRIWVIVGLFAGPGCFLAGGLAGIRRPSLVWALIAATTVALAMTTIQYTVLRAATDELQLAPLGFTGGLVLAAVAIFIFVRLHALAGWSMIVSALVLIMISLIVAPNFVRCRCHGPLTACKSNLKNIGTALEMYSTDFSGHYPTSLGALTPSYLKTIPTCPTAASDTYSMSYRKRAVPVDRYTMYCAGAYHAGTLLPDHPMYTSQEGLIASPPTPGSSEGTLSSGMPVLRTARLDETFLWVQALLALAGLLALTDVRSRLFGVAALIFAVLPWGMLVERDAAPITAYNGCLGNLVTLSQAVDTWREEHGSRPPTSLSQVVPKYLAALPTCPTHGKETYSASYTVDAAGHFTFGCSLGHPPPVGCPPGYPRYFEEGDRFLRVP